MIIGAAIIKMYAPWVHSLKEKRSIVKGIISKVQNKFNVSISEIEEQDIHQTIVIGIACVSGSVRLADSIIDNIIVFIEENTEAKIINVLREIR